MIKHLAMAIAVTFAPAAAFGQTYIVWEAADCGAITLHATRGSDFPKLGNTIAADQLREAYIHFPRQKLALNPTVAPRSLEFNANIAPDQVVMASVALAPVVVGNETRTERAKALIFCGPSTPPASWQRSNGFGLEIIPQGWNGPRPKMKRGDPMRFLALDSNATKKILDVPMELYRADSGRVAQGAPDKNGMTTFLYPEPGRYMVSTTYRRPDPQRPERWLVDTSTLTFEIK
ncbi:MAG: hypothetical protein WKF55_16370 [Gemmatimonadaceae bacterium]